MALKKGEVAHSLSGWVGGLLVWWSGWLGDVAGWVVCLAGWSGKKACGFALARRFTLSQNGYGEKDTHVSHGIAPQATQAKQKKIQFL